MNADTVATVVAAISTIGLFVVSIGSGALIANRLTKRRERKTQSLVRQNQLAEFWKAEQIRLHPNLKHLISGASFEKQSDWNAEWQEYQWLLKEFRSRDRKNPPLPPRTSASTSIMRER